MAVEPSPARRTATCACGGLTVTVAGDPVRVHACCCHNCQKESGSAFSYSAFFPEASVVAIDGERRSWGQGMGSGNGGESMFCPTCGSRLFMRLESLPGVIGIAVGCFADPDFPKPTTLYWWRRHHRWLAAPDGIRIMDTQ